MPRSTCLNIVKAVAVIVCVGATTTACLFGARDGHRADYHEDRHDDRGEHHEEHH
jgi:hypothetical protein